MGVVQAEIDRAIEGAIVHAHDRKHVRGFRDPKRGPVSEAGENGDLHSIITETLNDPDTQGFKANPNGRKLYFYNAHSNATLILDIDLPDSSSLYRPKTPHQGLNAFQNYVAEQVDMFILGERPQVASGGLQGVLATPDPVADRGRIRRLLEAATEQREGQGERHQGKTYFKTRSETDATELILTRQPNGLYALRKISPRVEEEFATARPALLSIPSEAAGLDAPHKSSLSETFGKRVGIIGGIIVGGSLIADGADAQEAATGIAEATVPFASAALAAAEGRYSESALRSVEEIPLVGLAISEVARPVAQAAGLDVDPSIGQMILSMASGGGTVMPGQQRFMALFDGLPDKASDDMPPEVASLAELKGLVRKGEERLEASNPAERAKAQTVLEAAEQRYTAQYDELVADGGIVEVEDWIAQNALAGTAPAPAAHSAETLRQRAALPALAP